MSGEIADPWPAQARRVLAVLEAGGVVRIDHPEGWVRIVGIGVVLHIRRERLEAIQSINAASLTPTSY